MTATEFVNSLGPLLAVLTPMVAVPLTVITFYLRSLREHFTARHNDLVGRIEATEGTVREWGRQVSDYERNYTTKEEWLRESMDARRRLENLQRSAIRIEAAMDALRGSEAEFEGARPFDDARGPKCEGTLGPRTIRVEEPL